VNAFPWESAITFGGIPNKEAAVAKLVEWARIHGGHGSACMEREICKELPAIELQA